MHRTLLVTALLMAPALAVAGCLECRPVMEVRSCMQGMSQCDPDPEEVRAWTSSHAAAWPELDALIQEMDRGLHLHLPMDRGTEQAFWEYWGVSMETIERDLWVEHAGTVFHIRVPTCG